MRPAPRRTVALSLVAAQLALPACAGMTEGEKQTWGTIGGALIGAAAGAAIGGKDHRLGGALIGAAVGGLAGYFLSTAFGENTPEEEKASPQFQEAQVHFDAGKTAIENGDHDTALRENQKAAELAPKEPGPHVNMGLSHLEKNDRAAAEASFRKALEIDPDNEEARANLEKMGVAV
jgi:tetratricopeptide (TPR) repeat protein